MLGPSDAWAQKGNDRFIRISARLKKEPTAEAEAAAPPSAPAAEAQPAPRVETAPAAKVEVAKPAEAPAAAPSAPKPAPPAEESKKAKPAPNFD